VIAAASVVKRHTVLVDRGAPQVQVAIRMVISIWLAIPGAAQPPWAFICRAPRALLGTLRVHREAGATSAAILRPSDIDDPMWGTQRSGGLDESLPILLGPWREDFHTNGATVHFSCTAYSLALFTLHQHARRVFSNKLDPVASTSSWATNLRLCGKGHPLAIIRLRVVIAIVVIPCHTVRIAWCVPQVQVAICVVVPIWLVVLGAAQPPGGSIGGLPRFLRWDIGIHKILLASSTAVLGTCHINDPIWRTERVGGPEKG